MSSSKDNQAVIARRNFLRTSSIGLVGGVCAATTAPSVTQAQERVSAVCSPEQFDASYAAMHLEIAKTAPGNEYLMSSEITDFARRMTDDSQNPADLKTILFKFYSLNAPTLEAVLEKMREINLENARKLGLDQNACGCADSESSISDSVSLLNQQALRETGLPFHLAILRGWVPPSERRSPFPSTARMQTTTAGQNDCPIKPFPGLYVGPVFFAWKLQWAGNCYKMKQPWDEKCNVNLGPFPTGIKNWFSSVPAVHSMVWTHGNGNKLQMDPVNLYLKRWITTSFGLWDWLLKLTLLTRKF